MRGPGWLRHNWLALAAVAVLLPVTVAITSANEWSTSLSASPSRPEEVSAGDTAQYGPSSWQVEKTTRVSATSAVGQERDLPAGTELLVVTVRVDPSRSVEDGASGGCVARLEEHGGPGPARSWGNASANPITLAGRGPEFASCSSEQSGPYSFDAEFVVPADAGDGAILSVGIAVSDELPDYLRMALD
ncbi:hypothetical protein [Cryobacterium sp. PAMC25264]|uniref:hypothetical protein n=1 Tax=Cryobacterium sp. PAMC25264 TaxID=2861288 RepID=UPI001C62EA0E|nr:hypothetical protein [Cryobacterium sp. PAMC25264]QYF75053.1 hypothetical protein KY500_08160 [Cryobacterium sp. PAMC25264]